MTTTGMPGRLAGASSAVNASEQWRHPTWLRSLLRLSTSGWNLVALQSGKGLASLEKPRSHTRCGQARRGADVAPYVLHIQHLRGFDAGRPTVALPMIVLL